MLKWICTCPSWSWRRIMTLNPLWAAWEYEMLLTPFRLISQGCQLRRIFSSQKLFTKLSWRSMKKVPRQQLPQVSWCWDQKHQQWLLKLTTLSSSSSNTTSPKPSSSLADSAHPSQSYSLPCRRHSLASSEANAKTRNSCCNWGEWDLNPFSIRPRAPDPEAQLLLCFSPTSKGQPWQWGVHNAVHPQSNAGCHPDWATEGSSVP